MQRVIVIILFTQLFACTGVTSTRPADIQPLKAISPGDTTATTSARTPDSLKKEMTEEINRFVKFGFYDSADLIERIGDMFYNEKIDTGWLAGTIGRAYRKELADQSGWRVPTDVDHLFIVFNSLNSKGIVSLHNAGNTKDEGEDDAREIRDSLKTKHIPCRGYCCYDSQDVDGAIDGNFLYLTFGDFENQEDACIRIGDEIVAALHRSGFKVQWDRSCQNRIMIKPFIWKNRLGGKEWGYDHAKELLTRTKSH